MSLEKISYRELKEAVKDIKEEIGDLSGLPTDDKSSVAAAVNELFTSAGNGKAAIAAAITGKGICTSASDSFAQMAENISLIATEAGGSQNSRCYVVTYDTDPDLNKYHEVNPSGDPQIASHRNDNTFAAAAVCVTPVGDVYSLRAILSANHSLGTGYSQASKGVYMRTTGTAVGSALCDVDITGEKVQSPGALNVSAQGVLSIYNPSGYPMRAGTYVIFCGW